MRPRTEAGPRYIERGVFGMLKVVMTGLRLQGFALSIALGGPLLLSACNALLAHDPGTPAVDASDAGPEGDATTAREAASDAAIEAAIEASPADACAAAEASCGSSTTDAFRPDHSGACPVACAGSACVPHLLAGNLSGASTVTAYENNVYWTNNLGGTVMVAPADGSSAATILATAQPHPTGIYVEPAGVFWAAMGTGNFDGVISRANFDGTNPEKLATYADGAYRLAGFLGYLYWSESGTPSSPISILRMEIGGFNERYVAKDFAASPTSLAVDASGVYWTTTEGTVSKAPIGCIYANDHACARTVVVGRVNPHAVAVGDGDLFWAEDGAVMTSRTDGSCAGAECPLPLVTNQASPVGLVVAGDELYWINAGAGPNDGSVMFMRRDGTCPTALATGQALPASIAVDDQRVYWLNAGSAPGFTDGTASSIPRPRH